MRRGKRNPMAARPGSCAPPTRRPSGHEPNRPASESAEPGNAASLREEPRGAPVRTMYTIERIDRALRRATPRGGHRPVARDLQSPRRPLELIAVAPGEV